MTEYDYQTIADEILKTAQGDSYYGNALRVAKDLPCVTDEDRSILDACLTGNHDRSLVEVRFRLKDIATKIRSEIKMQKLSNQSLLCAPRNKNVKSNSNQTSYLYFNFTDSKIHFHNLDTIGFNNKAKIRYFQHEKDPDNKFYIDVIDEDTFNKLSKNEQAQFFKLSNVSKNQPHRVSTGAKTLFETLDLPIKESYKTNNFKIIKFVERDVLEVDITDVKKNVK